MITKLLEKYEEWKGLEPKLSRKELSKYGYAELRLSHKDICITKRSTDSMTQETYILINLEPAKDLYDFLKVLFENEK